MRTLEPCLRARLCPLILIGKPGLCSLSQSYHCTAVPLYQRTCLQLRGCSPTLWTTNLESAKVNEPGRAGPPHRRDNRNPRRSSCYSLHCVFPEPLVSASAPIHPTFLSPALPFPFPTSFPRLFPSSLPTPHPSIHTTTPPHHRIISWFSPTYVHSTQIPTSLPTLPSPTSPHPLLSSLLSFAYHLPYASLLTLLLVDCLFLASSL